MTDENSEKTDYFFHNTEECGFHIVGITIFSIDSNICFIFFVGIKKTYFDKKRTISCIRIRLMLFCFIITISQIKKKYTSKWLSYILYLYMNLNMKGSTKYFIVKNNQQRKKTNSTHNTNLRYCLSIVCI